MRVTNGMIASRVVFNAQRSISRLLQLQTDMSSGRRINNPSDDPTGTVRDLDYREELAKIDQYQNNVSKALNWMGTYDTVLSDAKNFISTAKEVAITMANGDYDSTAREASASEIQSIFEQMLQLGNSELEGRRIFSGFRTKVKPLSASANGVVYSGDNGKIQFETESSTRTTINYNGNDIFLGTLKPLGEESDLNIAVTGDTLLSNLNDGAGVDLSAAPASITITDKNLNLVSNVDLSGATTVQDIVDTINAQLTTDGITNLTAAISDDGNSLSFTTVQTGQISVDTSLDKLNSGLGVDMDPGKIQVHNDSGIDVMVDLTTPISVASVETIGDVITEFNAQLAAAGVNNVTMAINAAGTGLEITDSNGVPLDLTISDVGTHEQTAVNLGIAGSVGASLTGTDLNPVVYFDIAEAGGTTGEDLGILGEFTSDFVGTDLDPKMTADSLIADFRNGLGIDLGEIVIRQGTDSFTLDMSSPTLVTIQDVIDRINTSPLDITASINPSGRGIQIVNDDPNKSLAIEEASTGRTAKDMGLYGSSDMMGSLMVLHSALKNDDQEAAGMLIENLDNAIQHLLNYRGSVGSQTMRLETTSSRLTDMTLNFTELLSDVEDADISELVTKLATQENNYQASLLASSKIIQPTLLDFLR